MLSVQEIESKYDIRFPEDKREEYSDAILKVFNGFCRPFEAEDNNDPFTCNVHSLYHSKVDKEFDQMKEYYLKAIGLDHVDAMFNLGYHYEVVEKNYALMKMYYLKAIDLNFITIDLWKMIMI